ncbi:hypothetical protein HNV11_12520 [Spirosoma taeanense]|uniref:Uncharacterized protein n=1 Tax=Spirosoma taeanense TaxID=2735870 RepID=A0A6M5YAB4_9BACT|nr:hypothetical protein [Spirosoma taeanense]QJW90143.1 hypothetical protein HNV11_12520 [Spirosoma taeanense]
MKMNTQSLINLEVNLAELTEAFQQLPSNTDGKKHHHAVKFPVTNDYGNACERELLFTWNAEYQDWELNTKGHDLIITASSR